MAENQVNGQFVEGYRTRTSQRTLQPTFCTTTKKKVRENKYGKKIRIKKYEKKIRGKSKEKNHVASGDVTSGQACAMVRSSGYSTNNNLSVPIYYYQNDRTSLFNYFNNIVPISIEYILFGCNEISEELNTSLFKSVQKFIRQTF